MSQVVAVNKRTGTEYIRVDEHRHGLLKVFTRHSKEGILAKPENIEILQEEPKAVKVIDKSSVPISVLTTPAQIDLYKLIVGKLESGEKITLEEARVIWMKKVHRDYMKDKDGHPMRWDYYHHKGWDSWQQKEVWLSGKTRLTEEEITYTVLNWLTRNIGLLVIKGALEVIPMIDLKKPTTITKEKV